MRVNIEEKSYDGKRKILKNIKLDIPKHQTTLIIGTSGAGKSTLIKCLIHQTKFKGTIIDKPVKMQSPWDFPHIVGTCDGMSRPADTLPDKAPHSELPAGIADLPTGIYSSIPHTSPREKPGKAARC